MRADVVRQISLALGAQVRAATEQIGDELAQVVAARAADAASDGVIQAVIEEEGALVSGEGPGRGAFRPALHHRASSAALSAVSPLSRRGRS